jgi:hypothetical protein
MARAGGSAGGRARPGDLLAREGHGVHASQPAAGLDPAADQRQRHDQRRRR